MEQFAKDDRSFFKTQSAEQVTLGSSHHIIASVWKRFWKMICECFSGMRGAINISHEKSNFLNIK